MVHPNNHLTKLDKFTIPNLESYKKVLDSQITKLVKTSRKEDTKVLEYKKIEKSYIASYLNVLKLLDSVEKCCIKEGCDYDYDKEDEILNSIEGEMIEFKNSEEKLKQLRDTSKDGFVNASVGNSTGNTRRESVVKCEEEMVENIGNVNIYKEGQEQ